MYTQRGAEVCWFCLSLFVCLFVYPVNWNSSPWVSVPACSLLSPGIILRWNFNEQAGCCVYLIAVWGGVLWVCMLRIHNPCAKNEDKCPGGWSFVSLSLLHIHVHPACGAVINGFAPRPQTSERLKTQSRVESSKLRTKIWINPRRFNFKGKNFKLWPNLFQSSY